MTKAIIDTGPVLHLNEINQLLALDVFEQLKLPDLVDNELRTYSVFAFNALQRYSVFYLIYE